MLIIKYFIDVISFVFILSFIYLMILWTFFLESMPQYGISIFRIVFWILMIWMVAITFMAIFKIIKYFHSFIFHRIKKSSV